MRSDKSKAIVALLFYVCNIDFAIHRLFTHIIY